MIIAWNELVTLHDGARKATVMAPRYPLGWALAQQGANSYWLRVYCIGEFGTEVPWDVELVTMSKAGTMHAHDSTHVLAWHVDAESGWTHTLLGRRA